MAAASTSLREIPNTYFIDKVTPGEPADAFVVGPASDNILASAFNLLKRDGLLPVLFFEEEPTLEDFIGWLKSPTVRYCVAFVGPILDDQRYHIAGIGVAWDISVQKESGLKYGEVGMAILRRFQVDGLSEPLIRKMISFAFDVVGLDIIGGCTPVTNRPALRMVDKCGFRRSHVIEKYRLVNGRSTDCLISFLTKDDWAEVNT